MSDSFFTLKAEFRFQKRVPEQTDLPNSPLFILVTPSEKLTVAKYLYKYTWVEINQLKENLNELIRWGKKHNNPIFGQMIGWKNSNGNKLGPNERDVKITISNNKLFVTKCPFKITVRNIQTSKEDVNKPKSQCCVLQSKVQFLKPVTNEVFSGQGFQLFKLDKKNNRDVLVYSLDFIPEEQLYNEIKKLMDFAITINNRITGEFYVVVGQQQQDGTVSKVEKLRIKMTEQRFDWNWNCTFVVMQLKK